MAAAGPVDPVTIRIEGLPRFVRALKDAGPAEVAAFKRVNYEVAQSIRDKALALANEQGGVAKKAAETLRAANTQGSASIRLGGPKAPYAWGAEFGAIRYPQFKNWKGNQWTGGDPGYFLYPTIRAERDNTLERYDKAFLEMAKYAFPD